MTTTPRRRRFPRSFGLRTLLVLVVVLAVPLAWIGKERRQSIRDCEIAAELTKQGWELNFCGPCDSYTPLGEVESKGAWCLLSRLLLGQRVYQAVAPRPRSISTTRQETLDLSLLVELASLRELYVSHTQVSDLSPISGIKKLEVLYIEHTPVSDLAPLSELTNLRYLAIRGTRVRDLSPLANLSNLGLLYVAYTPVSELRPVAGLKKLWRLFFQDCPVSDEQSAMIRAALPDCHIIPYPPGE